MRLLFDTSLSSVDVFGISNSLCWYLITSFMVPYVITELIWAVGMRMCLLVCVFCTLGVVIGILHNVVFESLYPSVTSLLSLVTVTLSW